MTRLTWVRNYALNWQTGKPAKSSTSLWHILHSVRVEEGKGYTRGFALTMCGQPLDNPKAYYHPLGAKRKCSSCATIAWALEKTGEVPDELVVREDG